MTKPSTLADLASAPYNPRMINEKALAGLGYSMAEFGDLSGVVFNERTGHLVAGHQRVKSLRAKYGDLEIADGQIRTPEGHAFAVRVVDWPLKKEKAANVAANAPGIQGVFVAEDLDALIAEIAVDMPDLSDALSLDELLSEIQTGEIPDESEWGAALGGLPSGEKPPFQTMSFVLSDDQADDVRDAIEAAKGLGPFIETGNENSNGNALARICEAYRVG